MVVFGESTVKEAALDWLAGLGWGRAHGPEIAPDTSAAERRDYGEVVLARRLREALARLNPELPAEALDDAFRKLTRPAGSTLEARNRAFHRLLVDGVTVEYRAADGAIRGAQARVVDFDEPREWVPREWVPGTFWLLESVRRLDSAEDEGPKRPMSRQCANHVAQSALGWRC